MPEHTWTDIGSVEALKTKPLQEVSVGKTKIALTYKDGAFAAISGVCNHVGGPLGEGRLYLDLSSATKWKQPPHAPHPLARPVLRCGRSRA